MTKRERRPENVFTPEYLTALREQDEPPLAGESEYAGPWKVIRVAEGWAVLREWEEIEAGHRPRVVVEDRSLARLIAAVLPVLGREPQFQMLEPPQGTTYPLANAGRVIGKVEGFQEDLVQAMSWLASLAGSASALAAMAQAAGPVVQEQAGEILFRELAGAGGR